MAHDEKNTPKAANNAKSTENEVLLQGTIVHKFVTPDVAILTINTGNATPVPNYPKVLFFGDLRTKVESDFNLRDHVTIKGNIQSSKKKENVKNQIMQSIFGESIEHTASTMQNAFGIESKNSYKPFVNTFKVAGHVLAIECPSPKVIRLTIRTKKNGHISFAKYVYYTQEPEKFLSRIHPQDFLCAVGCVQTSKVANNGETRHYQNYVLLELVKQI